MLLLYFGLCDLVVKEFGKVLNNASVLCHSESGGCKFEGLALAASLTKESDKVKYLALFIPF